MNNYFVTERLGQQRMTEALREADRARLARMAEASNERDLERDEFKGKVILDAAGAREVPSL